MIFCLKNGQKKKQRLKGDKKVFRPAFGCAHNPKVGQNAQLNLNQRINAFLQHDKFVLKSVLSKYERILLLARRILVMCICIFKYNLFWLGVFGVLKKRRT